MEGNKDPSLLVAMKKRQLDRYTSLPHKKRAKVFGDSPGFAGLTSESSESFAKEPLSNSASKNANNHKKMTPERLERKREINRLSAQRKRVRERLLLDQLSSQHAELTAQNQALARDNDHLEEVLKKAHEVALNTNKPLQDQITGLNDFLSAISSTKSQALCDIPNKAKLPITVPASSNLPTIPSTTKDIEAVVSALTNDHLMTVVQQLQTLQSQCCLNQQSSVPPPAVPQSQSTPTTIQGVAPGNSLGPTIVPSNEEKQTAEMLLILSQSRSATGAQSVSSFPPSSEKGSTAPAQLLSLLLQQQQQVPGHTQAAFPFVPQSTNLAPPPLPPPPALLLLQPSSTNCSALATPTPGAELLAAMVCIQQCLSKQQGTPPAQPQPRLVPWSSLTGPILTRPPSK